jgi:hypothetical protein
MHELFNERWFKITSPVPSVNFVVVEWCNPGWKMDVYGYEHNEWPHGDTYQDTLDELIRFLAIYTDASSVWSDYDTGEVLPMFDALVSVIGRVGDHRW